MKTSFRKTATIVHLSMILLVLATVAQCQTPAPAPTNTDPNAYTRIEEITPRSKARQLTEVYGEVDDQSAIRIAFDTSKMPGLDQNKMRQVEIRVEAFLVRGSTSSLITPIDNYVSKGESGGKGSSAVVYHDKPYDPSIGATVVPGTMINLKAIGAGTADQIEIRVTNLVTQEALSRILTPRPFGFRAKVTDSLMFLKRLGVSDTDRANGVEDFNFGPSPGFTYGGSYLSRGSNFARFLRPGVGINVTFTNWKEPSFDLATGKFVKGTSSTSIQTGMGIQFSLFNNVLQFTYGANLQVKQDRTYFGIGLSFVNLTSKLKGLIAD